MINIIDYFISIDGGGSKTEVCIYECATHNMLVKTYAGININQAGELLFTKLICTIFDSLPLRKEYKMIAGIPGYGEASETDRKIDSIFNKYLNKDQYTILNDVQLAHYASLGLKDGILILSGTGSMAVKMQGEKMSRAGGWGYLIGDEGSAFKIGLAALNYMTHVFDGIEETSILFDEICDEYHFDFSSKLISYVYTSSDYRMELARFAILVDKAAELGCQVAIKILEDAANDLLKLVYVLNDNNYKVSYAGSVFNSNTIIKTFKNEGSFEFAEPKLLVPVLGGIYKLSRLMAYENEQSISELNYTYIHCEKEDKKN